MRVYRIDGGLHPNRMARGELYRGYIVWKDGTLNIVKSPKENELWQNREQLEKALRKQVSKLKGAMPVKDALRAELEVVQTEILEIDEESDGESENER